MSVGNPNMASLFYLKAWVVSVSHIKYILLFSNHLQLELLIGPGAWKNSELPRYDEVLTTVPGYISAISGSSFIRCSILLFPPVISSQSSKQRWRKSSQKFNFPTTQPCSIFPLIIMRKSGRRGAWINGKEVYQCSVDGSFQASQKRKDTFWLAYCLGFIFSKTQISEQPYHFLYYLEVDIIITTIGQVWVDKKCFKF